MTNFLFSSLILSSTLMNPHPFEIRGWDIERYDPEYVIEMIHKAHAAGMNTISLSHEVVMNAEEILWDWHRYQHLKRFCDEAHALNMKIYFWNHQINNPPDDLIVVDETSGRRKLRLDDDRLWSWLDDRYERVVARVPNFDGIILSLTESNFQVHRDNVAITKMTQPERMAKVINTIYGALSRHGRQLIVRDFLRTPQEMDSFQKALKMVPDDVWVFTKCVPNDWQYKYPPHPLLGKVAPHKQIMELDLFNETGGNRDLVLPAPDYYKTQLLMARDKGLAGAIGRCDDGFKSNAGTPAEFNIFAYSKFLHDPNADVEALWKDFFVPFYGEKAAPTAISVLKECFEMVCAIRYTLGFWTGDHQASVKYADEHLINNTTTLWSNEPRYAAIEKLLMDSGPKAIEEVVHEKRNAQVVARKCMDMLDKSRDVFDPAKFSQLRGYFERALMHATQGEHWEHVYFALRWYRNTGSQDAKNELESALKACQEYVEGASKEGIVVEHLVSFMKEVRDEAEKVTKKPEN